MSDDTRYAKYSRETAMCVNLALATVEADLVEAIEGRGGTPEEELRRVLEKLQERLEVLEPFTKAA